jgi:hypothetical protein
MELPILLAIDTTYNWNRSDTVLGASELALEIAGEREDGSLIKYLLIGDGLPVGPNVERLRATPELIASLPGELRALAAAIEEEALAREQAVAEEKYRASLEEQQLLEKIDEEHERAVDAEDQLQYNIEHQETFHDETLTGTGIAGDPLSVVPGAMSGLSSRAVLQGDGTETAFDLPADFMYTRLSLVEINGLGQAPGADYALDAGARTITFTEAPESGDTIAVYYTAAN